jgi:copper(I)-binding protein
MPSPPSGSSLRRWTLAWLFVVLAGPALAAAAPKLYEYGPLTIEQPIARATPPGAKTGVVYFTIDNAGKDAEHLLRASTPVAAGVVLHQMAQKGGMMTMRAVPSLEIGPGARLELASSGYHLMLIDLKQPLKVGERFPLTLTFERLGTVTTSVTVESMGATAAGVR